MVTCLSPTHSHLHTIPDEDVCMISNSNITQSQVISQKTRLRVRPQLWAQLRYKHLSVCLPANLSEQTQRKGSTILVLLRFLLLASISPCHWTIFVGTTAEIEFPGKLAGWGIVTAEKLKQLHALFVYLLCSVFLVVNRRNLLEVNEPHHISQHSIRYIKTTKLKMLLELFSCQLNKKHSIFFYFVLLSHTQQCLGNCAYCKPAKHAFCQLSQILALSRNVKVLENLSSQGTNNRALDFCFQICL